MPSSRSRQRELARAKYHRQMVRKAAAERRRRQVWASASAALAVLLVVGFVSWRAGFLSDLFGDENQPAATSDVCFWTPTSPDANVTDVGTPPTTGVPTSGTRPMNITFAGGLVSAELDLTRAPCTAASFAHLAGQSFFDNTTCHRLLDSEAYVLQCGDPSGTGSGGPAYQFADEYLPPATEPTADPTASPDPGASTDPSGSTVIYPRGTLAMANGGPNTNGSQFFIVYRDSPFPPNYTIFGTVTSGLEVIEQIAGGGHDGSYDPNPGGGKPMNDATIQSLTVGEVQTTPAATTPPSGLPATPPPSTPASPQPSS